MDGPRSAGGHVSAQRATGAYRFDPAATAAATATALVVIGNSVYPSIPVAGWADAVVNEWLIWFAGSYLVALGCVTVWERLRPGRAVLVEF